MPAGKYWYPPRCRSKVMTEQSGMIGLRSWFGTESVKANWAKLLRNLKINYMTYLTCLPTTTELEEYADAVCLCSLAHRDK